MTPPVRPYRPIRPDASAVSRTPRPTPGLLDMIAQAIGAVDERASSGFPEGTLLGELPSYIEGPKVPSKIVGVAFRDPSGVVHSLEGFDRGHMGLWDDYVNKKLGYPLGTDGNDFERTRAMYASGLGNMRSKMVDGFITESGQFVDRPEALRILRANRTTSAVRPEYEQFGVTSEDIRRQLPRRR